MTNREYLCLALDFIARAQRPDGGFDAYVSTDALHMTRPQSRPTPFFTSLIAGCCVADPIGRPVAKRASDYLWTHAGAALSWNYWERNEAGSLMPGYPDDLDDTACALAAIARTTGLSASTQGKLARLLVAAESRLAGPYNTWFVPPERLGGWTDVDIGVNANVAYMLNGMSVMPPGLKRFISQALRHDDMKSVYYGDLAVLYLLSRVGVVDWRTSLGLRIRDSLHAKPAQHKAMDCALIVSCCVRLGLDVADYTDCLRHIRQVTVAASWSAAPFYIEARKAGATSYAGSPVLSAAFGYEALSLAAGAMDRSIEKVVSMRSEPAGYRLVRSYARRLPAGELRTSYSDMARVIRRQDNDGQIGGLAAMLAADTGAVLPDQLLTRLQAASINGWMAYTIYDDVLDGDGIVGRLCAANTAMRQCVEEFRLAVPDRSDFMQHVHDVLIITDAANAWEQANARSEVRKGQVCIRRLPDFEDRRQLAERSWGHLLAGSGVLIAQGYALNGPELTGWQQFFKHFLIARQLNDDAHDWQADLQAGRLTVVVCLLLQNETFPLCIDLSKRLVALKRLFWEETVVIVCQMIEEHLRLAAEALAECDFILDKRAYLQLLDRLSMAVTVTREGRANALSFMQAYQTI